VSQREALLEAEVAELRAQVERLRERLDELARWAEAEQERARERRESATWI